MVLVALEVYSTIMHVIVDVVILLLGACCYASVFVVIIVLVVAAIADILMLAIRCGVGAWWLS